MHQKFLIIRFSSIGDLVLTTPVIRCLKMQTGAEIHLVVKNKFSEVLKYNPHITKIWTIQESTSEILKDLRTESFDFVIDLHYNFRSILLSWQLRKPFVRFNKINVEKLLFTSFKINCLPDKHLVDRYFYSLSELGVKNDGKGLDYFIGPEENRSIDQLKLPDEFVVGILGATYYTKQIPLSKWKEIISSIDLPIVLLGGIAEKESGAQLYLHFSKQVIDYTGQININQSAAIIQRSKMVITPDTGMMHIAAALKKSIHVIWGNTIPQFGMYPYFGDAGGTVKNHEVQGLKCRPCTKLGYHACPKKHFDCMQKQVFNKQTLEI